MRVNLKMNLYSHTTCLHVCLFTCVQNKYLGNLGLGVTAASIFAMCKCTCPDTMKSMNDCAYRVYLNYLSGDNTKYVHMCIHTRPDACMHERKFPCTHTYTYKCMCIRMYVCICVSEYVFVHVYTYVHMYVCLLNCKHIFHGQICTPINENCVHTCVHMYVCSRSYA